jgi:hypothetical protein
MSFGGIEILFFGSDKTLERVSCFSAFSAFAERQDGLPLFSHTRIVLPPVEALGLTEDAIRTRIFTRAGSLLPVVSTGTQSGELLRGRVTLRFSPTLTTAGLVAAIEDLPPEAVVMIVSASTYRDPTVPQTDNPEGWVGHLARIARTLEPVTQPDKAIFLLDSGRLVPSKNGLAVLNEIETVSVCGFTNEHASAATLDLRLDQVFSRSGFEAVLAELGSAPGLEDWQRSLLKARYLGRADRPQESFGAYLPHIVQILEHTSAQTLVELAQIAIAAGQFPEASALIRRANPERVIDLEGLEAVIPLARLCGLSDLAEKLRTRVATLFPGTLSAVRAMVESLLQSQSFSEILWVLNDNAALIAEDESLRSVALVAAGLSGPKPDYRDLLRAVADKAPMALAAAQAFSIRHATSHGALDQALSLASEPALSDAGAAASLDALSEYFLRGETAKKGIEPILRPFERVVEYLAANPSKSRVRSALSFVLQPRISGVIGAATLAALLKKRLGLELTLTSSSDESAEPTTPEELLAFHEHFMSGLPDNSIRFAGSDVLPPHLVNKDLPRILSSYMQVVSFIVTHELKSNDDVNVLGQYLSAGLTVAKATRTEGATADLISLAGGGLARFGYFQGARDLAEHVLSMVDGSSSATERRHAWRCYADLYQRVHNPLESLLGMTCAAFTDDGQTHLSPNHFWNDVNTLVKTFRDLGFTDEARDILLSVRSFLETNHEFEAVQPRWDFLRCSLAVDSIERADSSAQAETARACAADIALLIEKAIESESDLVPLVGLATQAIPRVEVLAPEEARSLAATVEHAKSQLTEAQRRVVDIFTPIELETVVERFSGTRTRDSADLATDLRLLSIAARASLARACKTKEFLLGLLAIECIAFHGATVSDPGDISPSTSPFRHRDSKQPELAPVTDMLLSSRDEAADVVRTIVDLGIDVHALGIDSGRKAVRVSFYSDRAPEILDEPAFSLKALHAWTLTYPGAYSDVSRNDPFGDDVPRSLARLGLSCRVGQNETALLLDADLQVLPGNLVQADGTYCGAIAPITSIPSLGWLRTAERRSAEGYRRVAWFGDAAEGELSALRILRNDIEPELRANQFEILGGAPISISDAEIVLLGAHGSIFDDSLSGISAFRGFSDERSLRLSLDALCNLVEPCKVVILFACSAGRLDDMPFGQGLWGVPAALLRNGCRVVVASPWPLDVAVPGKWLPTFLLRLKAGDTVSRAAFEANHHLHEREPHPARWLAMHVYGDPRTKIDPKGR